MFTVVGSKGNLGSLLMKIFPDSYGVDVDNEEKLFNYLKKSDYAFLAIPPDQEENIINKYKFFYRIYRIIISEAKIFKI
ncbi:hypothetical protein [Acidiplasma cupricumulans]|uniref:hypothetical protein n=1 Tax=Acidiplasma cupricumulans TaxID=312540 RepID=UPI0007834B1C|nr:hypothetical protein [Acidiplasma cupricumulans]